MDVRMLAKTEMFDWPEENNPPTVDIPNTGMKMVDIDNPEQLAVFAGRQCYRSWNRPNPKTATPEGYIANIIDHSHLSVLEHLSCTFLIRDVSRTLSHELIRHRHLSFCLSGDTKVYLDRANRGAGHSGKGSSQTRTLEQLWEMWQDRRRTYVKTMTIRTVSDTGVVVHDHVKNIVQSGVKPVYRVVTADGNTIKSSENHLFWRPDGSWTQLGDMCVGDEIVANGKPLHQDKDWILSQVNRGLSTKAMANVAEVAEVTMRKWRRVHGCPGQGYDLSHHVKTVGPWNKGMSYEGAPHTEATKARISATRKERYPVNTDNWASGHSVSNHLYSHLRDLGCRRCLTVGVPTELDHIDSNPMNNAPANIQPLCIPCHKAKTWGTPPKKVYPTRIVSIEYVGEEMTYDIEMAGPYKRFVANGLVVHNSETSRRYCPVTEDDHFVVPPVISGTALGADPVLIESFKSATENGRDMAKVIEARLKQLDPTLTLKQRRSIARSAIPESLNTDIVVTGNLRSWREFLAKRGSIHAEDEIRLLAVLIAKELKEYFPATFADVEIDRSKCDSHPSLVVPLVNVGKQ